MSTPCTLMRLRDRLNLPWLALLSGVVFLLSQTLILLTLAPLDDPSALLRMQLTYTSAEQYLAQFAAWEHDGMLYAYRDHLLPDTLHPLWYGLFASTLLAIVLSRAGASQRWNLLLPLPALSALLDVLENTVQQLFLANSASITDALATFSWLCSSGKWLLVMVYLLAIIGWALVGRRR